ncbi:MAG: aminoacyl-tRNA hydrolase [Candidatus Gracilibacteria bacterium]|nr:aminoacyl-tRNA hydrolase [Candidatus Gracilibacteria bacterium]
MKLIIGLGNPGIKYEKTRHNIGFLFLNWLIENQKLNGEWKMESKFKSEIFETQFNFEKTILVKPQTYMNLSGESVLKMMSYYKIQKEDIIVIFDDISLEPGKTRFRATGSAGGQNGVKSIISNIGQDFKRVKIGIGQDKKFDLSDWVLSNFSNEEIEKYNGENFENTLKLINENI